MRWLLAFAGLWGAFALAWNAPVSAQLGRLLSSAERAALHAERIARTGRSGTALERLAAKPATASAASAAEVKALEKAWDEFRLTSLLKTGQLEEDVLAAAAKARASEGKSSRSARLSDDLPYVHVKLTRSARYDDVIRRFAEVRLREALDLPFEPGSLKVVVFGLADDVGRSKAELAKFRRSLPRRNWDDIGPLANLDRWQPLSQADKVAILARYRGKTVVAVGHVDDAAGSFFIFRDGKKVPLDIGSWSEAAAQAGVNFIPVGCNSAKLASLGAQGLINSGSVLSRLQRVAYSDRTTMKGFFEQFTGRDLILMVDPLEVRLFSSGLTLAERINGLEVGRLLLRGVSGWKDLRAQITAEARLYAPCFAVASRAEFRACDSRVRARLVQASAERDDVKRLEQRQSALAAAQERLRASTKDLQPTERNWRLALVILLPVALILALLLAHVPLGSALIEMERGFSWRRVFGREAFLESGRALPTLLSQLHETWRYFLVPLGAVVATWVAVAVPLGQDGLWFTVGASLGASVGFSFCWEAYRERSFSIAVAGGIVVLLGLSLGTIAHLGAKVGDLRSDVEYASQERAELLDESPNAAWRHEQVYYFFEEPPLPPPDPLPELTLS